MKKIYASLLITLLSVIKLNAQRIEVTSSIPSPVGLLLVDNDLYLTSELGGIFKMDINAPLPTIPTLVNNTLPNTYDMVFDDSSIYISDYSGNAINKLDLTTTPPTVSNVIINTSLTPYGLAIHNNFLYYTSLSNGKILKLDLSLPSPVEIEVISGLVGPFDIAIKGDNLYFSQQNSNKVSKIDLTTPIPIVTDVITNITAPIGLLFNENYLYINSLNHDTITMVNITESPIVKYIFDSGSGRNSAEMLFHDDHLYLAEYNSDRISKIETELDIDMIDIDITCNGLANGVATAMPSKGKPPYTYMWNTGATTASITGLNLGTYTVTITDNEGSVVIDSITITEPDSLETTVLIDSNATCANQTDGGASAIVTGGTAPYTYLWNNGATTASIINVTSGHYSVIITDANGCTSSASGYISAPITTETPMDIVSSGPYEWVDGITYTESSYGEATYTYTNMNGCDSNVTLYLTIIDYCSSRSTRNRFEWIKQVELDTDINNTSNKDANGYGDYTDQLLTVDTGDIVSVALTPGYKRRVYEEYWRIWADWNFDGDFNDPGEKVFEQKGKNVRTGTFTIPTNVDSNELRLRVSMRWKRYAPSCGNFRNGEVEDYKILVNHAQGSPYSDMDGKLEAPEDMPVENVYEFAEIFPNPVSKGNIISGYLRTEQSGEHHLSITNTLGQTVKNQWIHTNIDDENYFEVSTDGLPIGLYFMKINNSNDAVKIIIK